ncbi:hypothetical protein [Collimonas sp. OK412]|uniref:hypothetical protein n=1 Tax=Collimonas sp. (strain OK412) TaxID=1801619 RepID=UPI0008E23808|nr:hypothetical protein [Collimonas sp. OK412]SFD01007.1 hypothetical protein SAMN04515619_11949 [Collimonas sp. OK412]
MANDLIIKATSLMLAVGIVGGAVWLMSGPTTMDSINQAETKNVVRTSPPAIKDMKNRSYIASMESKPATEQPTGIIKCQSGGKTTYSDKKCAGAEQQTAIVIKETSGGFVSPDQQTIADTRARIREDIQRPGIVTMASESKPATTSNTQGQCYYLAEEIKSIDAGSNIGQSSWSQEQLRIRRLDVRNRMYRLGC